MKVLLTGATGFLGRTVARHLAARGHALRVLVRPASRLEGLPEGFEVATGDVTCPLSLTAAAEGCDAIVHMAALVRIWVPDPGQFLLPADAQNGHLRVVDYRRAEDTPDGPIVRHRKGPALHIGQINTAVPGFGSHEPQTGYVALE